MPPNHESRLYLLHRGTKLLCATCGNVSAVVDFRPLAKLAVLSCCHTRPIDQPTQRRAARA